MPWGPTPHQWWAGVHALAEACLPASPPPPRPCSPCPWPAAWWRHATQVRSLGVARLRAWWVWYVMGGGVGRALMGVACQTGVARVLGAGGREAESKGPGDRLASLAQHCCASTLAPTTMITQDSPSLAFDLKHLACAVALAHLPPETPAPQPQRRWPHGATCPGSWLTCSLVGCGAMQLMLDPHSSHSSQLSVCRCYKGPPQP